MRLDVVKEGRKEERQAEKRRDNLVPRLRRRRRGMTNGGTKQRRLAYRVADNRAKNKRTTFVSREYSLSPSPTEFLTPPNWARRPTAALLKEGAGGAALRGHVPRTRVYAVPPMYAEKSISSTVVQNCGCRRLPSVRLGGTSCLKTRPSRARGESNINSLNII